MKFAKFTTLSNKPFIHIAIINKRTYGPYAGTYSISDEFGRYNEFGDERMKSAGELMDILEQDGFIKVREDFEELNVDHLREVKSQLSEEFIDAWNLWIRYEG